MRQLRFRAAALTLSVFMAAWGVVFWRVESGHVLSAAAGTTATQVVSAASGGSSSSGSSGSSATSSSSSSPAAVQTGQS